MSTRELLNIVEKRGLRIVLKDGRPVLEGAAANPAVTGKLLAVLKIHRERIVSLLDRGAPGTAGPRRRAY